MSKNKNILIKESNAEKIASIKFATSYFSRLKGLMFKKDLDYVLVLKPKVNNPSASAIHTCFMRMIIDVVFLDENKKVNEIKQLSPWKFYKPQAGARYILELKEGSIEKYNIKIGEKFDFICEFR